MPIMRLQAARLLHRLLLRCPLNREFLLLFDHELVLFLFLFIGLESVFVRL